MSDRRDGVKVDCMHLESRAASRPESTDDRFWRWPGVWTVQEERPCDLCGEMLVLGDRFVELLVEEYAPPEVYDVRCKRLCVRCARLIGDVVKSLHDGRGCSGSDCERQTCLHRKA